MSKQLEHDKAMVRAGYETARAEADRLRAGLATLQEGVRDFLHRYATQGVNMADLHALVEDLDADSEPVRVVVVDRSKDGATVEGDMSRLTEDPEGRPFLLVPLEKP